MKVKATRLGYYNHIRQREGAIFDLSDSKHFSSRWMERVNGEHDEIVEEKRPRGNPNWRKK